MRVLSVAVTEVGFPGWRGGGQVSCHGVLWCSLSVSPICQHDLGLRREGLAQGRSMHARTVRIGAHCEKSRRRMAAGESGQGPGEMVIAGVPPVLVRWGKVGFRNCSLNAADVGEGMAAHVRNGSVPGGLVWLDTSFYVLFFFFFQLSLPDGGPRSAGWREHGERRRKFDFDLRGDRGGCGEEDGRVGGGSSHLRRCRGLDGFEDDKDGLPEWCLDDEDEEMGTFDASGAFLPLKVPSQGPGGVD